LQDFTIAMNVAQMLMSQYPEWWAEVEAARKQPPLPLDYLPNTCLMFDQFGVVAGLIYGLPYESERSSLEESHFMAWYFDEELVLFYSGTEIFVNRLSYLEIATEFFGSLKAA
jgi:hypothetical protein